MSLEQNGYLTIEEIKSKRELPTADRYSKGPVAVIECVQEIPCNPCEAACTLKAIHIGEPITNLPQIDFERCIGCGTCIARCPGLAIFVIDKTFSSTCGTVSFPHEYWPLPEKNQQVAACDRSGKTVCDGTIVRVVNPGKYDRTPVVTVAVPLEFVDSVRGIRRA